MKLLVLAGGAGSRLRAAVADRPKALAPTGGRPFLDLQMKNWHAQGLRDFIFLLHHQADQVIAYLTEAKANAFADCAIDWVLEPVPLDTGGAVAHAVQVLDLRTDFLLTNADTWLGSSIAAMRESPVPSLAVVHTAQSGRYGQVQFDDARRVTAFREKNPDMGSGWINAGLCHLEPGLFADWDGKPLSIERGLFPKWVAAGALYAVPLETDFIDIGIPEDYYRFCRWVDAGGREPLCS